MPYVITRESAGLKFKVGDELKCEKGDLPDALLFSATWKEPEAEQKPEKKAKASK